MAEPSRPTFWFDLSSPECWLVAERINGELPVVPAWQPVHLPTVRGGEPPEQSTSPADRRAALERSAAAEGQPPVRWPEPFPADTALAMRAAVFAQASGRAVAFSLAAFRQAFLAGRDLGDLDNVVLAAAACELHPRAVLKGIETRSVADRLADACTEAAAAGLRTVPTVYAGGAIFEGDQLLERASAVLGDGRFLG